MRYESDDERQTRASLFESNNGGVTGFVFHNAQSAVVFPVFAAAGRQLRTGIGQEGNRQKRGV